MSYKNKPSAPTLNILGIPISQWPALQVQVGLLRQSEHGAGILHHPNVDHVLSALSRGGLVQLLRRLMPADALPTVFSWETLQAEADRVDGSTPPQADETEIVPNSQPEETEIVPSSQPDEREILPSSQPDEREILPSSQPSQTASRGNAGMTPPPEDAQDEEGASSSAQWRLRVEAGLAALSTQERQDREDTLTGRKVQSALLRGLLSATVGANQTMKKERLRRRKRAANTKVETQNKRRRKLSSTLVPGSSDGSSGEGSGEDKDSNADTPPIKKSKDLSVEREIRKMAANLALDENRGRMIGGLHDLVKRLWSQVASGNDPNDSAVMAVTKHPNNDGGMTEVRAFQQAWKDIVVQEKQTAWAMAAYCWKMTRLHKTYMQVVAAIQEERKARKSELIASKGTAGGPRPSGVKATTEAKLRLFTQTRDRPDQAAKVTDQYDSLDSLRKQGSGDRGFADQVTAFQKKLDWAASWEFLEHELGGGEAVWLATLGVGWPRQWIEKNTNRKTLKLFAGTVHEVWPMLSRDCAAVGRTLRLSGNGCWALTDNVVSQIQGLGEGDNDSNAGLSQTQPLARVLEVMSGSPGNEGEKEPSKEDEDTDEQQEGINDKEDEYGGGESDDDIYNMVALDDYMDY